MTKEIVPGVFTWGQRSPKFGYDFNGYYFAEARVMVDPVEGAPSDVRVDRIVLTNRNHFRDAQRVREKTGARVMIHVADRGFVESKGVTVDEALATGVGPFTCVPAPGKSPGEVALYWPARKLLLIGDACVGPAPGTLGLLPDAVIDDKARLLASLRQIAAAVDFDTLLLGDGHSMLTGAREALRTLAG